jgi:cupin 2 domain-containing protein
MTPNLFDVPVRDTQSELVTPLADASTFRVERIVSWGDVTPDGIWYDQDQDEWVIVLQGEGVVENDRGASTVLKTGNALYIPAHMRHRVVHTSVAPPCIWLAVHGKAPAHDALA